MEKMKTNICDIADEKIKQAHKIIKEAKIIDAWESIGAKVNLIGSVKSGLLMKNRDIDFHIYSDSLDITESFKAIMKIAENPSIKRVEYNNLADTEEKCIEWHAWYLNSNNDLWQIDMIHILKGSAFDGYMEKVTQRVIEALTPELRKTILQLKYDTPDTEKIPGIEYYKAVLKDNISSYQELSEWRKKNSTGGIVEWMP